MNYKPGIFNMNRRVKIWGSVRDIYIKYKSLEGIEYVSFANYHVSVFGFKNKI